MNTTTYINDPANPPISVYVSECGNSDMHTVSVSVETIKPTVGVIIAEMGARGPQGVQEESFESISANLKSWNSVFNRTSGVLTSEVFSSGTSTITKTYNYSGSILTSITISGNVPETVTKRTKNFIWSGPDLSAITYTT